tara:strand:- start:5220 stop:5612 length:393 start_codon:yes stop_codon:yes gene_type:complete
MTRIESQQVDVNKSAEEIYNFISNFDNFEQLMPSSVEDLKTTENTCSFSIKGMPAICLKIGEKTPFTHVSMVADGGQIAFSLNCSLEANGNNCKAQLFFEAELNMMMKMMVEKPLTNFLNILVDRLKEIN